MNPDAPPRGPRAWLPRYGGRRWPYAVLDVLLVGLLASCLIAEASLGRIDATAPYPLKPTWGLGEDWLLVTHDDLPERHSLTGTGGRRIDTAMELHLRHDGGRPLLVSLPLRTTATIAGYGAASLGTAYDRGGPRLLIRGVESIIHVSVDHYVEIGLGGLVSLADAVGGVRICADEPTRVAAPRASANCSTISGNRALDYLRDGNLPHAHPGPAERRRRLLAAVIEKATSPEAALEPARTIAFVRTALAVVTVDRGNHLYDLVRLALALCDGAVTAKTIPTVNGAWLPGVGRIVGWDPKTMAELVPSLVVDRPEPKGLIPG
ncbi:LCP family protein [Actinoallomurus sp. CA-150999]|uniref:LCP family protein n=1 Tax=Actinoallomurus sp. CA-150999 TaxID=3239887 RepID=UPI003D93BA23